MNKLRYLLYCLAIFLFVSFLSCKDNYDNFSTDPNKVLAFSTDTLSFDTLLSTIGSATKKFMIYNNHKEPLLISSIKLLHGNRGFRMNVPPERHDANGNFYDVRISPEDSLYVFVEATLSENATNTPQFQSDEIIFITNGKQQRVVLAAYSQDVEILKSYVFEKDTILSNKKPYLVFDSLTVNGKVTLTIQEGTTFYMHAKSWFNVKGNIKAKGSLSQPIVFRGDRLDYLINIPYDRVPGRWDGMWFASTSYDNEFEYVHIRNGMFAMIFEAPEEPDKLKLKLKNSVLTNMNGNILSAENCYIEVENSELSNASGALLYLVGGKYDFTHCTLANYMSVWYSALAGQTIVMCNYTYDDKGKRMPLPVERANFSNSIIYGSNTKAAEYAIYKDSIDTPLNYKFQNCLLLKKDGKNDEEKFIKCIFNEDPKFLKSTYKALDKKEEDDFIYDFRLNSESPARDKADVTIAKKYPLDINGISRFDDKGPDIGAYEWFRTE